MSEEAGKLHARAAAREVLGRRAQLAQALVAQEFDRHPELAQRYGAQGRAKSLQDAGYHFSYLAQALAFGNPVLFTDYVGWLKVVLRQRKVRSDDLVFHFECAARVLREQLPVEAGAAAGALVDEAVRALPAMPEGLPSFMSETSPLSALARRFLDALLRSDRHGASRLVLSAVRGGASVRQVYLEVFQPVQREVGRLWQMNLISVAREHYCTAATQLVMSQLYPQFLGSASSGRSVVVTSVAGDLHELGARMVADFLELEGWETFYTGASTPQASVIEAVVEHRADVLAVSATIAYHLPEVQALIAALRKDPRCARVKVLVGGYPFNCAPDLWREVGADAGASDAQDAVLVAARLLA